MADAIYHTDAPGLTLYVRLRTAPTTSVAAALTEGTSSGVGYYYVTEAQLVTAGLTVAGDYPYKIFVGTPSTSADDYQVGAGILSWTGSAVVSAAFPANFAALGINVSGHVSRVTVTDSTTSGGGLDAAGVRAAIGLATANLDDQLDDIELTGTSQPRINQHPTPGFTRKISNRADGTHEAPLPINLPAGVVGDIAVFIDMAPLFGREIFVKTVGVPTISGGSVTAVELGPRDTYAVFELGGTATLGEERTVTATITMETLEEVDIEFTVKGIAP